METLTKLSARSLEYYINARRWKSDLCFFDLEIDFLNKLIYKCLKGILYKNDIDKLQGYQKKLSELSNEKHQIKELLDNQLKDLELLSQDLLKENIEELTSKHAQLDILMVDWLNEYKKLKKEFFVTINGFLTSNKSL